MVRKADIHILLIEELIDLLYEMNDVSNIHREVDVAHGQHLHHRLLKTLFYIGFTAEQASKQSNNPRQTIDFINETLSVCPCDGYVDKTDLTYALKRCELHIQRMRMAYSPELEEPFLTLLQIIELCLTDTNCFIYERTRSTTGSLPDTDRTGQPKGNLQFAD